MSSARLKDLVKSGACETLIFYCVKKRQIRSNLADENTYGLDLKGKSPCGINFLQHSNIQKINFWEMIFFFIYSRSVSLKMRGLVTNSRRTRSQS